MLTPLWLVEKSCTNKRWYGTKAQARAGRQRAERVGKQKYRIYRCSFCERWHLTTVKDNAHARD